MSDKTAPPAPDYAALAQRYLELWQDQVAKLAKEPPREMGDLTAMTQAWSKMAASMAPGASGYDAGAHGASTSAASHGHGGVDRAGGPGGIDAQLATRLTAIEQRLAAIESQLANLAPKPSKPRAAGGGRGAGKKP